MDHPYGEQYSQEGNPRAYMTMRDYRNLPYQWQQPVERNPSEYRSMRDYRDLPYQWQNQQPVGRNPNPPRSMREYRDKWMSAPVYGVPSTYPPPPQYAPPEPQCYAPTSQQQQPPPLSPLVEQAILDLTRIVDDFVEENKKIKAHSIVTMEDNLNKKIDGLKDDFEHKWDNLQDSIEDLIDQQQCPPEEECQSGTRVEEQRVVTVQANQETETVESSLNNELDGFQSKIDQNLDILQESISKLAQQPDQEEENMEAECLTETILVEQAQLQPQEELKMESVETPEELQDALESSVAFWPWRKEEEITAPLTEESIKTKAVEVPKKNIIQPNPIDLDTTATAQDTYYPLPVAPSDDQVYILPTPATKPKPAAPAPKGKSNPPLVAIQQNFRRLVTSVHAFATTSKTMATAYIAWHSGWFGFGTPGPRHF